VNTFARSAATAATALGACWILFVLVLPTLLNLVVESLHPTPSRAELVAEARAAASEAEKRGLELVSSFYKDHPELAPPGLQADMLSRYLAVQDEVGRAMAPVKQRFDSALLEQQRVVERWRFLSPAIAANEALTDLAGTGYWRYRAFEQQVAEFKQRVLAFYEPKFHRREPLQKSDLPHIPSFSFVEEPRASWTTRVNLGLVGILALTLLATLAAGARLSPTRLAAS
jgi:ABC-2 type transport system permease protein